jgi:hypothetical protein
MSRFWQRLALIIAAFAAAGHCVASDKPNKPDKSDKPDKTEKPKRNDKGPKISDDAAAWSDHVVPGPAVTIQLKRIVGKPLIYEGSIDRTQEALNTYHETGTFYLNELCADRQDGLDLLAVWRTYVDRKRTEKLENGKVINPALPNTNDLINLGPNYSIVGTLRCYRYDDFNRLAYRSEQLITMKDGRKLYGSTLKEEGDTLTFLTATDKFDLPKPEIESTKVIPYPHVCLNDTPHYFFPIFSARTVSPGDTWKFKVPVIIPAEQPNGGVLPTQFDINYVGRLREVRTAGGTQIAVVDYQVSGAFDSQNPECAERFAANFLENNRIVHRLTGTGVCTVDVQKGRILEKSEVFNIGLFAHSTVTVGMDKPPKDEETKADVISRYEFKLLAPGTKLNSGAVVPDYDEPK